MWFLAMKRLRDCLREVPEDKAWTSETVNVCIHSALDSRIVATSLAALLIDVIRLKTITLGDVRSLVAVEEGDEDALHVLYFHLNRVRNTGVKANYTRVLDLIVDQTRLLSDAPRIQGYGRPGPVRRSWISDKLLDINLQRKLMEHTSVLENVADQDRD